MAEILMLRRLGGLGACGQQEQEQEQREGAGDTNVSVHPPTGAHTHTQHLQRTAVEGSQGHSGVILFVVPFISLAEVSYESLRRRIICFC